MNPVRCSGREKLRPWPVGEGRARDCVDARRQAAMFCPARFGAARSRTAVGDEMAPRLTPVCPIGGSCLAFPPVSVSGRAGRLLAGLSRIFRADDRGRHSAGDPNFWRERRDHVEEGQRSLPADPDRRSDRGCHRSHLPRTPPRPGFATHAARARDPVPPPTRAVTALASSPSGFDLVGRVWGLGCSRRSLAHECGCRTVWHRSSTAARHIQHGVHDLALGMDRRAASGPSLRPRAKTAHRSPTGDR
jgi:hypothetical protein